MEISIKRSPQHWCLSEGSNSELFAHKSDALTARIHVYTTYEMKKHHESLELCFL